MQQHLTVGEAKKKKVTIFQERDAETNKKQKKTYSVDSTSTLSFPSSQ